MDKAQLISYWHELPWSEIKLKANKVLPKFIFILLIVLITQTFAEMTWRFFTPEQESVSNKIKNNITLVIPVAINTGLKEVSAYHLFGDAKNQVVVQQEVIDAPETRLRLDLKGVFASTIAEQALAIISSSKGKDKTYHIGDKVTGGAILHAVYADRVILKRNGKLETLRLPKSKVDSKAFYNIKSSGSSSYNVRSSKNKSASIDKRLNAASAQIALTPSQRLRNIRDTLLKDPAKVWQQVRINPVMKNGNIQGYTLAHNDQALMSALNIRKTDIITEVNGESLSDPATLYSLMGSMSDQQSMELTIERNGQQQTIHLSF